MLHGQLDARVINNSRTMKNWALCFEEESDELLWSSKLKK